MKKSKTNKQKPLEAIITSRDNPDLNYGQTLDYVEFNEFSDMCIVIPHGEKQAYEVHYSEIELVDELDYCVI